MPTIHDSRHAKAMTVAEADALFQKIAETTIEATSVAAHYEKEIANIKAIAAQKQQQFDNLLAPMTTDLQNYVAAHPERFQSPRQRKTEFGKYGLRSVTKLYVDDEPSAIISVKAQAIPALVITEKLDKKALEKAISDGFTITGVEVRSGELVKYDVETKLLNKAKKGDL